MPADDLDTQLLRIGLWTIFAHAAIVANRPTRADVLGFKSVAEVADDLLADICQRWPDLAEPAAQQ